MHSLKRVFFLGLIDTSLILFQAFGEPKVMFSWEDHINKGYTRKRTPASTASWEGASDGGHTRRLLRQNVQHRSASARFHSNHSLKAEICCKKNALCWILDTINIYIFFLFFFLMSQKFWTWGQQVLKTNNQLNTSCIPMVELALSNKLSAA